MQNVLHYYRKISLFSQIFKAVATIRGQEKYKDIEPKYFLWTFLLLNTSEDNILYLNTKSKNGIAEEF